MKIKPALASASLAAVVAMAIGSGCETKISRCSSDTDCPLGTCDLTVNRCAFVVCDAGCPQATICNAAVGNLCVPGPYSGIVIVQPRDGAYLDGGTPVFAQLNLNPGFQRQDPPSLPLGIRLPDGGTTSSTLALTSTPGSYQGALVPMGDGQYQLTVRYDAANVSSVPVTVTILTVRPSFILTMPPIPVGPSAGYLNPIDPAIGDAGWRRDQVMLLDIKSSNPYLATVTLTVTGVGGPRTGTPLLTVDAGCVQQPFCATAPVDFSVPDMNAFRGTFNLVVTGTDRAGNQGTTDAGVMVTRWKWKFQTLDGLTIRTSPTIGSSGTVYVGTSDVVAGGGIDAGTLYAINPDGTLKWSRAGGWMTASVAVGEVDAGVETIYAAANNATQSTLRAINGNDGGDFGSGVVCGPFVGATIRGSLAVTKTNGNEVCFAAINAPDGGVILAMRPFPTVMCIDGGTVNPGGPLLEPAAIAVDSNNNVFFALSSLKIQSLGFDGGWQIRNPANWPVDAGANSAGLAITSNPSLVNTNLVVGGATALNGGRGGAFALAASDGGQTWTFTDAGDPRTAWNPSIGAGGINGIGIAFYGDEGQKLTSVAVSTTNSLFAVDAGLSRGAPVIGRNQAFNRSELYIADSTSNRLSAFESTTLNPLWTVTNFNGGFFEASIALDCTRRGDGSASPFRPGILYVPDNAQNLFCFVTDSAGIDVTAPWPKYQHDPRNTGNQQTQLTGCP